MYPYSAACVGEGFKTRKAPPRASGPRKRNNKREMSIRRTERTERSKRPGMHRYDTRQFWSLDRFWACSLLTDQGTLNLVDLTEENSDAEVDKSYTYCS